MKKSLRALAMLVLTLASAPAIAGPPASSLRIMSFNVRVPVDADGPNAWPNRRDLFVDTVRRAAPDIIGTQELKHEQGAWLIARLPQYAWFGIDRRGGHADEHMGIFYRHDRLKLVDLGNFWLSDTPTVPGSISWGHPYPRMVTWGLFERRADGRRFMLLDTHFPYRTGDVEARRKAAAAIAARIAALPRDLPVIVTGDFNASPDEPAHAALAEALADARSATASVTGPAATFHNFTGNPDRRIDWILERGFTVQHFATDTHHAGNRYPSDHFPVVADMALR